MPVIQNKRGHRKPSGFAIALILTLALFPAKALANRIDIGFLEDMCDYHGTNVMYTAKVRLAFMSTGSSWKAYDHSAEDSKALSNAASNFAGNRQWVLLRHDRSVAQVASKGVDKYDWYKDIGLQDLITDLPVEVKGPRDLQFSGWIGCPVRKPIVLATAPPARDQENWRNEKPSYVPTDAIADHIQNSIDEIYQDNDLETEKLTISKKDLVAAEQYVSNKSDKLIAFRFCSKGPLRNGDDDAVLYWFYVHDKTPPTFIGRGLVLIDWADYNSDGETEFLFWIDGYNENGYLMTWGSFARNASFTWHYH